MKSWLTRVWTMGIDYGYVNGYRMRYRLEGPDEAPLVVFGHGLLGSLDQVDQHAPGLHTLFEQIRLLVYDARGHGESEGPEEPHEYTWATLGEDMAAVAELAAGGQPAIFGGGSMGAATSLWVALECPERVRGLVLAIPPPIGRDAIRAEDERAAISMLDFLATAIQNYGLEKTVEIVRQTPGFAGSPEESDERAAWLLSQNPRTIIPILRGLLAAPHHDPEEYRRIKAPALIIAHEGDGLHPMRSARLLAENIPGSRLIVGDQRGYWREHPDELIAELRDFFRDVA